MSRSRLTRDTWTGSDQWLAERMAQAAQNVAIAAGFGEREAELRAEADACSHGLANAKHAKLTAAADDCLAQRTRYRAAAIATLDDLLPFLTKP